MIVLKPGQLFKLNERIVLLSDYKKQCDKTVASADSLISDYKTNEQNLKALITNKDLELSNNQTEIGNLKEIQKKTRKKWIKNFIYGTGGGIVAGLVTGILIAK